MYILSYTYKCTDIKYSDIKQNSLQDNNGKEIETRMTTFIKAKLENKRILTNVDWLQIKYYRILYKSKILFKCVIKKLKEFKTNILAFLDFNIKIPSLLY